MKTIQLTRGQVALVDDEDYEWLNQWKWYAMKHPYGYYAGRNITSGINQQKKLKMHRVILGLTDPKTTGDHISGFTLDNRRCNLRVATTSENLRNQVKQRTPSTSKYKGLTFRSNKYDIRIVVNGKTIHLGSAKNELQGAKKYNEAAIKYFGEFARLNIFDE